MTPKYNENRQLRQKAESLTAQQGRELADKEAKSRELQASLNRAEMENESKDSKIKALEQALKAQAPVMPTKESGQLTKLPQATFEGSQPRTIDAIMHSEQPSLENGASDIDISQELIYEKYRGLFPPDTPTQDQETGRSIVTKRDHHAQPLGINDVRRNGDDNSPIDTRQRSSKEKTSNASQQASNPSKEIKNTAREVVSSTQGSQTTHSTIKVTRGSKRDAVTAELAQSQPSHSRKPRQNMQGSGQASITFPPTRSVGMPERIVPSTRRPSKPGRKSRKGMSCLVPNGRMLKAMKVVRLMHASMPSPDAGKQTCIAIQGKEAIIIIIEFAIFADLVFSFMLD